MFDQFNRKINYLRISVTDLCNLRCTYCMPAEGIQKFLHSQILSFEEIREVVEVGRDLGITKVRLTGGEPLVRKGIVDLVAMLSTIPGIEDLSMTTNGVLLPRFARSLKKAGLHRVNISLDAIDPVRFQQITRIGNVYDVLAGIEAAMDAGLRPIKINTVIIKGVNEEDARQVAAYCRTNKLEIRYIQQMKLSSGQFSVVEGGEGGNCKICNRLRLTSDGYIKPCLFSDLQYSIHEHGIHGAYALALANKPKHGTFSHQHEFYNIGG